jgi:hypothetical protein
VSDDDDWRLPEERLRAALWQAETHLQRGEFFAAARALTGTRGLGEDDLLAGVRHLAAAGYRAQDGEPARARRQLEHARRRLASFLPEAHEVELQPLIDAVAMVVESTGGRGELA